jgi:malate dehydrogenase (oxaloacetate-decarboxylating)(NADP+)
LFALLRFYIFASNMDQQKKQTTDALYYHEYKKPGKLAIVATKSLIKQEDLALAYSPGVAEPCLEIQKNPQDAYRYTAKGNLVAVISNGTAVLGLGNLGALASKPVMEGKAVLFKKFADIDSIDIEVSTQDPEEFIKTVKNIALTFGGINLEDIKSPECFEIEERLKAELDIPVFHDDQHGTAIIACAGLINSAQITGRNLKDLRVVVNGCGAAGVSCIELMKTLGIKNIIVCDQSGVIHKNRQFAKNDRKQLYAIDTNIRTLEEALDGADAFLGLSVANALPPEYLAKMNKDPIIFAMANPDPEIKPELAKKARPDAIIATGRSDYPNQINNVMCFPYLFRGALDVRAKKFNTEMKLAAVYAIAELARQPIPDEVLSAYSGQQIIYGKNYIIPKPFDPRLISAIAPSVAKAAMQTGVASKNITDIEGYKHSLYGRMCPVSGALSTASASARSNKKCIIFAEGEEEKAIRSAIQWRDLGYGSAILVGRQSIIDARMKDLGVMDKSQIQISNAAICDKNQEYIDSMYKSLQRRGYLYRTCVRSVKTDRNVFASCLLQHGDGDIMITGLTRGYRQSLQDVMPIIEMNDVLFGISFVVIENKTFFIADTAVNDCMDAKTLAKVAIKSAAAVKQMGHKPSVAMIAHSNFGSVDSDSAKKAREAVEILNNQKVDFEYDGEMCIDVAIDKEAANAYPFCRLSSTANVLIMPNIESANAACKFAQSACNATVIGPILLGAKKPAQIAQMHSSVSEILNLAVLAAKMG